jgi:hypothetical protein
MVFILSNDGRDDKFPAVRTAFERYRNYLKQNEAAFPPRAHKLATSDWFHSPHDHRSPHDARLESLEIAEMPGPKAHLRSCSISVRLLGAHHDGHIKITYPRVLSYSFQSFMAGKVSSHGGWRYDEFRLSERGHLIHEIEWAGAPGAQGKAFSWIIEADDIDFLWIPASAGED